MARTILLIACTNLATNCNVKDQESYIVIHETVIIRLHLTVINTMMMSQVDDKYSQLWKVDRRVNH